MKNIKKGEKQLKNNTIPIMHKLICYNFLFKPETGSMVFVN